MYCLHIITGLNDGGAEAVLYRLCKHDQANDHHVVSLYGSGKYGPMLEALGVTVRTLNMSPGWPSPLAFIRLVRLLRREHPDVVQTWMYHGDLFGGLAARAAGIRSVVWGIRHTTLEPGKSKKTTIWIAKLLAKLSWWLPSKIVVCAQRARDVIPSLTNTGPLREWAEALLDEQRLRQEGFFNPEPIRKMWAEHLSGKRRWHEPLWNILMLQAWYEHWHKA